MGRLDKHMEQSYYRIRRNGWIGEEGLVCIERLANIISENKNIVFFGGAGVSTASGIPDFRSADGLFNRKLNQTLQPEQMVSRSYYDLFPEEFFDYYKKNMIYPDAQPNGCHKALAQLELMGKVGAVITQNIDGLHQKAGSKNVFELHGSVHRNYCTGCKAFFDARFMLESEGVPTCPRCGAVVKPDVVLYEEMLDEDVLSGAVEAIESADVLIIGGTSLVVMPAAQLVHYFRGKQLVLINKTTTPADDKAQLILRGDIAQIFVQTMELLKLDA